MVQSFQHLHWIQSLLVALDVLHLVEVRLCISADSVEAVSVSREHKSWNWVVYDSLSCEVVVRSLELVKRTTHKDLSQVIL